MFVKGLCYSYVKAAPNQLLNIQHNITTNDSSTVWFGNSGLDGTKLVKSAPKKACISSAVGVRIAKRKEKKTHSIFLNYMISTELVFGKWCTKAQTCLRLRCTINHQSNNFH